MNKNTIPLIIIVIVIICFGLAGLGLVIHNIKNDEKHLRLRLEPTITGKEKTLYGLRNFGSQNTSQSGSVSGWRGVRLLYLPFK